MIRNSNKRFKLLVVLSVTILLLVLFFGLRGNGYKFSNDVTWIKDEPGIRFGNYGIVYAVIDKDHIKNNLSATQTFSIEIAIKPEGFNPDGFNLILSLHDGEDCNQLMVGQYKSYIVIMNGDDYENRRKIKRISADIFSKPSKKLLLTITTGDEGTKLFVDGKLIKAKSDLILTIPVENIPRLILGNSVYGNSPWRGEMYSLAFYANKLELETIENRFNSWSNTQVLPYTKNGKPILFFMFNERTGTQTTDYVTRIQKLNIPTSFLILEKRFLSPPWRYFKANKSFLMDFIVNLLGFIPLGFILCALCIQSRGIFQKKAILFSLILCFLISLCIEIAQAWIPSRSSLALDIILNTISALIGAMLCSPLLKNEEMLIKKFRES